MKSFTDKVVVVVAGAGSGMGRAHAIEFEKERARLALRDIDPVGLRETLDALRAPTPSRVFSSTCRASSG
jgi:NADP-dependent 3-hydroxy acid dehydrogenase YdfG